MLANYSDENYSDLEFEVKPTKDGIYFHLGKPFACTVTLAAQQFRLSTRRVRQMLIDGKLKGSKIGQAWKVAYPYQIVMGRRGPLMAYNKIVRNGRLRKKARNIIDFINPTLNRVD
ncbi:MAG: hypothetical protein ABL925_20210 [Methylococcales bacterium]